jgi:hypothetical protein
VRPAGQREKGHVDGVAAQIGRAHRVERKGGCRGSSGLEDQGVVGFFPFPIFF